MARVQLVKGFPEFFMQLLQGDFCCQARKPRASGICKLYATAPGWIYVMHTCSRVRSMVPNRKQAYKSLSWSPKGNKPTNHSDLNGNQCT